MNAAVTDTRKYDRGPGLYLTGGVRGFDPPQEVVDPPPESSAEPLWGVDSNPPKSPPDSIFLLNQYNYVTNSVTFFRVIIPISADSNRYPVPV